MAERRMFTKMIIDSDLFLDMPLSTQCLYFHLAMRADDDGFINNPKKIMRMIGASEDDMRVLMAKQFILTFDSGVIVIKHWKLHNYIQKDRYNETMFIEEKNQITLDSKNIYQMREDNELPMIGVAKERKPLTTAQQKRLDAKKESELPYSFDYKIRQAFIGEECPICHHLMSNECDTNKPSIQHNVPISLGGKHELDNISVICLSCNNSIQNRKITEPLNTEKVKAVWECIGNGVGMDTQVRIGKERERDSLDKERKDKKKESFDDILNLVNGITDELKDAYLEFIKMRKLIKKPLTNYALKNIIKKVDEYSNGDIQIMIAILNQSIVNSWQGVFPLKNPTPTAPKTKISVPDVDDDDFKLPFEV